MSEIRDKVKREIELILINYLNDKVHLFDAEEQILAIKEIAIIDRQAELPQIPEYQYDSEDNRNMLRRGAINYSKMLAGWVKEIKKWV